MQLNLPTYTFNIKAKPNGSKVIFDTLRRRFVTLTPEEWVRQHFVRFLVDEKGFPAALMANEVIVEYKAPHIEISQNTFDQIVRYNMVLHASYLIVSNGLNHYCCRINYADDSYVFLNDIPSYSDLSNP